jgi:putative flavoprotein involved in K+ transport
VIWATGFALPLVHPTPVLDDTGMPVHQRGVTVSPGLYFLGLQWQHTRGSALLGWVKDDAEHLADHIARFARANSPAATEPIAAATVSGPPPR